MDRGEPRPEAAARTPRARAALALAGYLCVFAILLARALSASATAFPRGNNPVDSRLLAWTQAAVASRLLSDPGALFEAPIFHPAPRQLAGAEAFLSSQVVFAPVYGLSGNAVLAANALVVLSYPAAAFAMERLLAALGASPLIGWTIGLLFALGPLAVPANIQVTQYPIVYLPVVALALHRLRERPTAWRAALLAGAYLLAIFSSYYMAALVTLAGACWALLELARPEPGRARFTLRAAAAVLVPAGLLVAFSAPYLERRAAAEDVFRLRTLARAQRPEGVARPPAAGGDAASEAGLAGARPVSGEGGAEPGEPAQPGAPAPRVPAAAPEPPAVPFPPLWLRFAWPPLLDVSLVLALAGLGGLASGSRVARGLAIAGAVVAGLGVAALAAFLSGLLTPLPAPLAFFRNPFRLTAVTGFGVALLGAGALEAARSRFGARAGRGIAVAVLGLLVATRGTALVSPTLDPVDPLARHAEAYRRAGAFARAHGGGALLELPLDGERRDVLLTDAMVASTLHGLPSITGFGPVFPLHWPLVAGPIARLPEPEALQELVDLTGLRWVLLQPAEAWGESGATRERIAREIAATGPVRLETDGWLLQRIDLPPRHPEWAAALARGYRSGESLLGTPYDAALPGDPAAGRLRAPIAAEASAGGVLALPVVVENRSGRTWPGALSGNGGAPGEVFVEARWRRARGGDAAHAAGVGEGPSGEGEPRGGAAIAGSDVGLRRDLPGGESLEQELVLPVPVAGSWSLELRIARRGARGAVAYLDAGPIAARISVRSR